METNKAIKMLYDQWVCSDECEAGYHAIEAHHNTNTPEGAVEYAQCREELGFVSGFRLAMEIALCGRRSGTHD